MYELERGEAVTEIVFVTGADAIAFFVAFVIAATAASATLNCPGWTRAKFESMSYPVSLVNLCFSTFDILGNEKKK